MAYMKPRTPAAAVALDELTLPTSTHEAVSPAALEMDETVGLLALVTLSQLIAMSNVSPTSTTPWVQVTVVVDVVEVPLP
jgi:hypothetical protein